MLGRAKLNFVVDVLILVAFLAAAVSGLVLLIMPHGGYQGGRNPDFGTAVLYLSRDAWNDVHVWGSLAVIAGIAVHVALHWRWIVCIVKRFLVAGQPGAVAGAEAVPVLVTDLDS